MTVREEDNQPFQSKQERDELIDKYWQAFREAKKHLGKNKDLRKKYNNKKEQLEELYYKKLPIVNMGVCPFCGHVLKRMFDPYGLDGDWWLAAWISTKNEPEPCEHFYLLCGAVNFLKKPIKGHPYLTIIQGPEAPYVIRPELEPEGRIAVISKLVMEPGYLVYPITYFSNPPREKKGRFYSGWRMKEDYIYGESPDGPPREWIETSWHNWDFELKKWLQKGKIRWCEPESGNGELSQASPEKCPFVGLPGERRPMNVENDKLRGGFA